MNPGVLRVQLDVNFSLLNSNYSLIMLQSSGHLATERPFSFDNPINNIYYINQNTVKHEH